MTISKRTTLGISVAVIVLHWIFIVTRFEKCFGPAGLFVGVVLSSAMFGSAHLFLRRRSAIEPIVAHAFSDVLAIVAATMLAR